MSDLTQSKISKYSKELIRERINEIKPKYDQALSFIAQYEGHILEQQDELNKWLKIKSDLEKELNALKEDLKKDESSSLLTK